MKFNGIDLSGYIQTSAVRPLMPAPTVDVSTTPGKDGFEVKSVRLESVSVPVECLIVPGSLSTRRERIEDADQIKRTVANLLFTREKRPLVFDSDPLRYCMAILSGVSDVERSEYVDKLTITFLCEPYFYTPERTIGLTGSQGVYVAGAQETRPVFEIASTSNTSFMKIQNTGTGKFVQVNAPLKAGSKTVIDMETRRATVNGASTAVTMESDFFPLAPGRNDLALSSGSATIRYKEVTL